MFVCCECCVLSGRGLCDELITRPEESYRLWCVVVCDLETSSKRRPWPARGRSATRKKNTVNKVTTSGAENVFNSQQEEYTRNVPYECTESLLEPLHGIFSTQLTSRKGPVRVLYVLKDMCLQQQSFMLRIKCKAL